MHITKFKLRWWVLKGRSTNRLGRLFEHMLEYIVQAGHSTTAPPKVEAAEPQQIAVRVE